MRHFPLEANCAAIRSLQATWTATLDRLPIWQQACRRIFHYGVEKVTVINLFEVKALDGTNPQSAAV
jgi:hypothetical protein